MSEIPQGSNFGIKPFPRPNWGVQRSRSFLGSPAFYAVDYEEPFRGPLARVSSALGNVAEPDPRIPQRQGPYQPPFPLYPSWYSRNYFPCQPHKDYSLTDTHGWNHHNYEVNRAYHYKPTPIRRFYSEKDYDHYRPLDKREHSNNFYNWLFGYDSHYNTFRPQRTYKFLDMDRYA